MNVTRLVTRFTTRLATSVHSNQLSMGHGDQRATLRAVRSRSVLLAGALGLCVAMLPARSHAQDETARANARTLATEGVSAFNASNWTSAIDFFERAESQFHSPVHLWYIAQSAEKASQLVKAQEACRKVEREGIADDASAGVLGARDGCAELLPTLDGRIPKLTVTVTGGEEGASFVVTRNGQLMPRALIGIPAPVDPGEQKLVATANGYISEEKVLTLAEGASESITLELHVDPNAKIDEPEELDGEAAKVEDKRGLPTPHWPAYVAWGVGLGGIAAGVVFGLDSQGKANDADDLCGDGGRASCALDAGSNDADRVVELNDQAGTSQLISIIGYGVGGAALATGVVFWLLEVGGPKKKEAAALHPEIHPVLGFGHVGVAGTF